MNNISIKVPYEIGTYLIKEEYKRKHVDQVHEYIIGKEELFIILMLDVLENPRLSNRITLKDLLSNWKEITCSPEEFIKEEILKEKNILIEEILKKVPSIGDEYEYRGYLSNDYDMILENLGCTIERYDFGIETTVITRIKDLTKDSKYYHQPKTKKLKI